MTLKYPTITAGRKSLTGRTLWCGPFAVAQITGLDYDTAYAKVLADIRRAAMAARKKKYAGRPAADLKWSLRTSPLPTVVKGTYEHQIARLLNKLKVKTKLVYSKSWSTKQWPTLITFVRDHTIKGHTYIVVAGHHWVTIKDGILYHAHHAPCPIEDAKRYRMAKVECWADVKPLPAAILPEIEQPLQEAV